MADRLLVAELGTVEYGAAVALQHELHTRRRAGALEDVLLMLEHPPVYTCGRRSEPGELPMGEAWYRGQGIDVVTTDRGGRVTYHGPGQLVGYPIIQIVDVVDYLRRIERAIVAALSDFGVGTGVREGLTGVWAQDRKIASIGVHVSRGVTTHGFAVNVENDLQPFEWIVPCGLEGVRMTSVGRESGRFDLAGFRGRVAVRFCEELGRELVEVDAEVVGTAGAGARTPA